MATRIIGLEEGWGKVYRQGILKLQNIIKGGLKESFTNAEYADLYTTVYDMCIQKDPNCHTAELYTRFVQSVTDYLEQEIRPAVLDKEGEFMIEELVNRWKDFKVMQKWLTDIFKYLDRFYVHRFNCKPLAEVCIHKFRMVMYESVRGRLTKAVLELVLRDRNGEQIRRDMLRDVMQMSVELGMGSMKIYETDFEQPLIQATEQYYAQQAAEWLAGDSCPVYLNKAHRRFEEEKQRRSDFLHPSTEPKLMQTLYDTVLIKHQMQILTKEGSGCKSMLEADAYDDLRLLYDLYSLIQSLLKPIAAIAKSHIAAVGHALVARVQAGQDLSEYTPQLIQLHHKFNEMIARCFDGNGIFHKTLKEAFEEVVNARLEQNTSAELIAQYADLILRKGGLRLNDEQLEHKLDEVVRLFNFLIDKDLFSEFYRKQLAKRLLLQNSESTEAEKAMISKMKLICGAQFTHKLEGMIVDMQRADDHAQKFASYVRQHGIDLSGIDLGVRTLTAGFWPSYQSTNVLFPSIMSRCMEAFHAYYQTQTTNRRLRWIHELGQLTLTGRFQQRRVDIMMSTSQAAVLMLFNQHESLSIEQLIKMTDLTPEAMKLTLRSMVSGKFKILNKTPDKGYNLDHRMSVNHDFRHPMRVIRLPNPNALTSSKDRQSAQQAVSEDRKFAIEASIVRVMKARLHMTHQQLVAEVSKQLMQFFNPNPAQIKQRIEHLISREYMERDGEQTNLYHYLA